MCHTHSRTQAEGQPASQSLLATVIGKEKQAAQALALEASTQKQHDFHSHFTVQNTTCSQTSLQMGGESRPIRLPKERARKEIVSSSSDYPGRRKRREERTEAGERGEERGRKEGKCRERERVGNQRVEGRNGQLPEAGMSSEENSWIIENRLGYLDLGEIRAFLALFWLCWKVLRLRDPRRLSAFPSSKKGGSATATTAATHIILPDSPCLSPHLLPSSPFSPLNVFLENLILHPGSMLNSSCQILEAVL